MELLMLRCAILAKQKKSNPEDQVTHRGKKNYKNNYTILIVFNNRQTRANVNTKTKKF